MAEKHSVMVWEKSPQDIDPVDLLVLLRLADNVMDEHGNGMTDVQLIAKTVRETEQRVNTSLRLLQERGIITIRPTTQEDSPWQYPWIFFRFEDSADWE